MLVVLLAGVVMLAVKIGAGIAQTPQADAAEWTLQGRVYEGDVGEEPPNSQPLEGVTVAVYGANAAYPESGAFLRSTTTNSEGWYGLTIYDDDTSLYDYIYILESAPAGYLSTGATTVSGTVKSNNWIEYVIPLEGKTLTGNKFWDQPPMLSGRVYEGSEGDESAPLDGVSVELYCSNDTGSLGDQIDITATDAEGWYGLSAYSGCEFYNILEVDPSGYTSVGATTVSGTVATEGWIQYVVPLDGKTLTGNKFWDQSETAEPDLVITDLWDEDDVLCYQLMNVGDAPAPGGHTTALFVDSVEVFSDSIGVELGTAQRYGNCFDWSCSGTEDDIEARADVEGAVPESDEANNTIAETWQCDVTPPEIISGPIVSEIAQDSAVITWETDEESDSLVKYDTIAGAYGLDAADDTLTATHSVALMGLEPSTTYHFAVRSSDAEGNAVTSQDVIFETPSSPDEEDPSVALNASATLTETVTITASASDKNGVEQVAFYLGEELLLTDYTPPFELTLDTTVYENGAYALGARAVDLSGRLSEDDLTVDMSNVKDSSYPVVTITSPGQGDTVSGIVTVTATISDDTGIISARFYVDGDYRQFEPFDISNPPKSATVTFPWDTRGESNNTQYRLGVQVFDKEGKVRVDTVDVIVNNVSSPPPPSPPWLVVTNHTVTRFNNIFAIALTVKNTGDAEARNVVIRDGLLGFQAIANDASDATYSTEYNPKGGFGYSEIEPKFSIPAGASRIYAYNAMPVMMYPNPPTPRVGYFIDMEWDSPTQTGYHNYIQQPVGQTIMGESISQAHANALKEADYLIVTNPYRLFLLYNPAYYQGASQQRQRVNALLSTMAELAYHKEGALGYVTTYSAPALRNLIKSGGSWSSKLKSNWASSGYLLIVGETQIVPAWSRYLGTQYTTKGDIKFVASSTDYPYASTYGDDLKPELSVGRIIGDNADRLREPIQTSINSYKGQTGYEFDGLLKFLVDGFPKCMSGGCDNINFKYEVDSVVKALSGSIIGMHTPDAAQYNKDGDILITATKHAITSTFFTYSPDRDIIFLAGHGNAGSWDVLGAGDIVNQSSPFGSTSPFVFASSCATGKYPAGFSFAEAMLYKGAAAYMGAIEIGACGTDGKCPNADKFFANWNTNKSFALALKQTKRGLGNGFLDRWWAAIYHVFGDVKFGTTGSSTTAAKVTRTSSLTPPTSFDVEVPDYEISEVDGDDYVEIPDGDVFLTTGAPIVPVYRVFYEYPGDYQVQDVHMIYRSDPVEVSGLNIPTTTIALPGDNSMDSLQEVQADVVYPHPAWWPRIDDIREKEFEWTTFENAHTTTLALTLYPFYYNALTTEGLFYKNYSFEVDYITSTVAITRLETDQPIYEQGAPMLVDLGLESTALEGEGQDVVVKAVIEEAGSGTVVDGLLLRTLKDLKGEAAYSPEWDSAGFDPGSYSVVVEVTDAGGALLDTTRETFQLGISSGEIADFTVIPTCFDVGDGIDVSLEFSNTGTVAISGTLVIQIQDETGETVQEYTQEVAGLAPGESITFDEVWDTTDVEEGTFSILGYALYDGKSSEPATAIVSTERRIYLPLVLRS